MSFKILGTGRFIPPKIVTNDDLSKIMDTSDEWIVERTGIRERHVCTEETTVDMAVEAAKNALENAGVDPSELDMILFTTSSGDYTTPANACLVQARIGATCPAMDVVSGCPAFLFMLDCADGYFARGRVKKMLCVSAERMSRVLDWDDRGTAVIFGDGAGAVVLGEGDNYLTSRLFVKGSTAIQIPNYDGKSPFYTSHAETPWVHMQGQETFRFAVTRMVKDIRGVLEDTGLTMDDIRHILPHQANLRIIEAAKKRLKARDGLLYVNINRYGNTSSATIPISLDELNRSGQIKEGDYLVFSTFGAGLSSAACVVRW
ncbi:MAG: ketoacyl-ACP synthase III [Clostridia bacterium]|nr:ketoacyl-ACP synthase III [Clostridia bacterium]